MWRRGTHSLHSLLRIICYDMRWQTFRGFRDKVQRAVFAPQMLASSIDPDVRRQDPVLGKREVVVPSQ